MSLVPGLAQLPGLAHLPAARAVGGPSVNVIHHPKLIPVVIAAVVAVLAVWIGISLSRWRRITWREHMDAPVSLVPKGARKNGTGTAWKGVRAPPGGRGPLTRAAARQELGIRERQRA